MSSRVYKMNSAGTLPGSGSPRELGSPRRLGRRPLGCPGLAAMVRRWRTPGVYRKGTIGLNRTGYRRRVRSITRAPRGLQETQAPDQALVLLSEGLVLGVQITVVLRPFLVVGLEVPAGGEQSARVALGPQVGSYPGDEALGVSLGSGASALGTRTRLTRAVAAF
jgi:hypothetical protein